jgi:hypothetical protein
MEIPMRNLFYAALASLSLGLAVVPAYAASTVAGDSGPVREGQGVTTALSGNVSALTYWVSESDGWHVVTTVDTVTGQNDETEDHTVVRFSSVLLPGQSQLISVPFAIGEQQKALRIRRLDDQIRVEFVPVA